MTPYPLSQAKPGQHCVVLEIQPGASEIRSRLYALGVIPGSTLEILRFAPFGDPMQVKVGGSLLSIRRRDAETIQVSSAPDSGGSGADAKSS